MQVRSRPQNSNSVFAVGTSGYAMRLRDPPYTMRLRDDSLRLSHKVGVSTLQEMSASLDVQGKLWGAWRTAACHNVRGSS